MTHSASEIFTMQLGRGAAKQANRFLAVRGLRKSDRDDVTAAAMLWCWENRAKYSLTTTLETWFMNAIRDAYKTLQRGELPISDESIDNMGGGDETFNRIAAESSAKAVFAALTPTERRVVLLIAKGYSREEMIEMGITKRTIDESRQKAKLLRRLLPGEIEGGRNVGLLGVLARRAPTSDNADDALSDIDVALEQLDAPPPHGKECPPCVHCNWWAFKYRAAESPQIEVTADAEVLEAQRNILQRKIEISSKVEQ